jgi:hypothetical protein
VAYVGQKMTIFPLCLVRDFLLLAGFAESFLNPAGLREQKIRENKSSRAVYLNWLAGECASF